MKGKPFIAPVITAVVTAVAVLIVTNVVSDAGEKLEKGDEAATVEQIKAVLQEVMVADVNGETKTYGQLLSSMDTRLTKIESTQTNMKEALTALSED